MADSSIGVPQILPRSRARWQDSHPAPKRRDDESGEGSADKEDRPPPPPGTGEIVDRVV
jgi:hypothetical protein